MSLLVLEAMGEEWVDDNGDNDSISKGGGGVSVFCGVDDDGGVKMLEIIGCSDDVLLK